MSMVKVTINGKEFKNLKECANEYNINYDSLYYIYYKNKKITEEDIEKLIKRNKNIEEISDENNSSDVAKLNQKEVVKSNSANVESNNKCTILTGDMNDLFHYIIKYSPKEINLIDFENTVGEDLSEYLTENSFNIFFYNACIYSNNFYKLIKNSKSINFQVVTLTVASQLIDKILLFYIGALYSKFNNIKYNIISKDYGYLTFIESINSKESKNISIKGIEIETDKELQFVKTICTYLTKNKYIKSGKYYNRDKLKSILKDWHLKRYDYFTDRDFNHLVSILVDYKCLTIVNKEYGQRYLFIFQEINKLSFNDINKIDKD